MYCWPKGCQLVFPQPHPWAWSFATAAPRTQRNTLHLSVCFMMKTIPHNTDKHLDKEIHRVRPGKVLGTGASYPMKLRIATLLACSRIHQPINSQDSAISGFLCRPHHCHDWSLTQFLVPLAFQKDGWRGKKFQTSDHGLGFHGGLVVKKKKKTKKQRPTCRCRKEDPLEEEMVTHSNILGWKIPWTEEPGGLEPMGLPKSQTWLGH